MKNQTKRPLFLSGLVMNIVSFVLLIISSAIYIFYISKDMSSNAIDDATIINLLINILLVLIGIINVALSSVCLLRVNFSCEKFHAKRFLILTAFTLNIMSIILAVVGMRTMGFDILTLFITIALICSSVFLIITHYRNENIYFKSKQEIDSKNK